jgi:hypothetical protein
MRIATTEKLITFDQLCDDLHIIASIKAGIDLPVTADD